MKFTLFLLVAYAMASGSTQAQLTTTATTGQQTTATIAATTTQALTSTAQSGTTAASGTTDSPAGTTDDDMTTAGPVVTTGDSGTTDSGSATTAPINPPKAKEYKVIVETSFPTMTETDFSAAKKNLTTVFAKELGVNEDQLALTFDKESKKVKVEVTGLDKAKADATKAKVEGRTFTDDLNQKLQDKGVGFNSTGSSSKVEEVKTATTAATTKVQSGTTAPSDPPTGSSSALTIVVGLLALLAY